MTDPMNTSSTPIPGPLDAEGVKLLRKGDLCMVEAVSFQTRAGAKFTGPEIKPVEAVSHTHIRFSDGSGWRTSNHLPWGVSFLGRPDAMSQGLKKRVWSPILSRARQALQSIGSGE